MARAVQQRTIETRARLIAAAEEIISEHGFEALRVEEVVLRAGTAKGTFFTHFKDKDALMDLIIGTRIDEYLDDLESLPAPITVDALVDALMPLSEFMTCERYVFDVILRYSGAAAVEDIGPIATTFGRQIEALAKWLSAAPFRTDIPVDVQAEGVQAFILQVLGTHFCALHNTRTIRDSLLLYLKAWLTPGAQRRR